MSTDADRIDAALDERRIELGLLWDDVATAAHVSYETLRNIRRGRPSRALNKANLERALKLQRGSIDRLVAGGDIVPLDEGESVVSRNARAEVERRLARVKARYPAEYELIMRAVRALDDEQVAQIVTEQ